jgi:arylsulfatase
MESPVPKISFRYSWLILGALLLFRAAHALAADKPNVLVIFGDDIGWFNISAYNDGMMGYRTPNLDRIANEGARFTDWYGQQSCTAGRAALITGQSPIRTGLLKVGLPGAKEGMPEGAPTIAGLLKNHGYMTGQFGKNHFGDRDEHLPTNHGFDEFFGNLYHLNAEEEPENPDYPKDPEFLKKYGPRGVIKSSVDGKVQDTGPLSKKRMESVDEEFLAASLDFMDRAHTAGKPFFMWFNASRMHVWTHLKPESEGRTGYGIYADGMVEHDGHVGQLLDKLEALDIADNTVVIYSSDNGAEVMTWPDGGTIPFRGEKNTNWEGGYRVPYLMRWPGVIKPGIVVNEIGSHEDVLPTVLAAAGEADVKEKLAEGGHQAIGRTYKVHIDGYNLMPYFKGETNVWPRPEFLYWTDGGQLADLRYNDWKAVFLEQRAHGGEVWQDPFVELRMPKLFNLKMDPFERADHESIFYQKWKFDRMFTMVPAQQLVFDWLKTFEEYPPLQEVASWSIDGVMEKMMKAGSRARH